MNSEWSAAICVKRNDVSFSGHNSKSSDIHSGRPDVASFFLVSVRETEMNQIVGTLINVSNVALFTRVLFPLRILT